MRLKKLTITGFKSFADRVALDFDCDIIGIVGPNGCGKSNIVDAFRWVMGEQSAKSLRGDKMHDVLFAGAEQRKPLNYAEVSVTLTDIQGELPIPYDELTIARRLYRSGESEYYINKELARLKDVQSLFLGSGIGKNAFSIFEQGKLDQIIHLNPAERRAIFDEAAGTSRFLLRKKETIRKLSAVSENYARVHDVHMEIEKQAKQLKRQASHAKNFQENKKRLVELERSVLLFRLKAIIEKNCAIEENLSQVVNAAQERLASAAAFEESLHQKKQNLLEAEILTKEHQKNANLAETKLRVIESEITQQKHRLVEIKKREESLKGHLAELTKEQSSSLKELAQKELSQAGTVEKTEQCLNELKAKKERHLVIDNSVRGKRELLKKVQTQHLALMHESARLNGSLQEKIFRHEAKLTRMSALMELGKQQAASFQALEEKITLQKKKMGDLSILIDASKKEIAAEEQKFHQLRQQIGEAGKEEHARLRKITEAEGHQKALSRLKEEMAGFSDGAKFLMKEAKNQKSSLYKKVEPLVEYLIPKKGDEKLVASSMRPYADTLVVASEEDLALVITFAKKKKISGFSVIVKTKIPKGKAQPGTLSTHLEPNLLAYHFGSQLTLAEEGHFFDQLGVFFYLGEGQEPNNAFLREAELKELAELLVQLHQEASSHANHLQKLSDELKLSEKQRSLLSEAHRKREMDLIQENFVLQQALSDFEKVKKESAAIKKEREGLLNLDAEQKEITGQKEKQVALKNEAEQLSHHLVELEKSMDQEQAELLKSTQLVQTAEAAFHEAKDAAQKIQQEIAILKAKQQQRLTHTQKIELETEELKTAVETTIKTILRQEGEFESLNLSLKGLHQSAKEHEKKLMEIRKECEALEKELNLRRKASYQLEKEQHSLELILAKDLSEREGIELELRERHSLALEGVRNPSDIPESGLDMSLEQAMKETQRLRASVEEAGAVNMTAIEEFQDTQARFDFLDKQLKDLEESKRDLEEIIAKLDQECRKVFKKTFQQIRENFQKNFVLLFNGGSADLTFTESTDILEAGIEIVAKPPGKQMRAISLLSGGEKCLTALALLFSIFEVRPAPFCILDEVDAPLDDTNIDRFTHVLKQYIDKTQFIIVTHNKKTMAIADLLIGVSMEEKGVSKLISLAFEKREQHSHAIVD